MVGGAYERLVNTTIKSLKPVFGKKPLGQLMLASNIFLKNYLHNTTDEDN